MAKEDQATEMDLDLVLVLVLVPGLAQGLAQGLVVPLAIEEGHNLEMVPLAPDLDQMEAEDKGLGMDLLAPALAMALEVLVEAEEGHLSEMDLPAQDLDQVGLGDLRLGMDPQDQVQDLGQVLVLMVDHLTEMVPDQVVVALPNLEMGHQEGHQVAEDQEEDLMEEVPTHVQGS